MKRKINVILFLIVLAVILTLFIYLLKNKDKNMITELNAKDYDKVEMQLGGSSYTFSNSEQIEELVSLIQSKKLIKRTEFDDTKAGFLSIIDFYKDNKILKTVVIAGYTDICICDEVSKDSYCEYYDFDEASSEECFEEYKEFFFKYSGFSENEAD